MGCRDNKCRWTCTMDTEHDSDTAKYCTVEVDDFEEDEQAECVASINGNTVTSKDTEYKAGLIGGSYGTRGPYEEWFQYSDEFFKGRGEETEDTDFCKKGKIVYRGCRDEKCRWTCTMDIENNSNTAKYCTVDGPKRIDNTSSTESLTREITTSHDVIKVNLNGDYKIIVNAVPNGQSAKSVKALMDEVGGVAAINGAFFDAYSKTQSSDMIAIRNGQKRAVYGDDLGNERALFGFTSEGTPIMATNATRYWDNSRNGRANDEFSKMQYALSMQMLIDHGRDVSSANAAMNNDSKQGKA
ncbi:MAG: phosphodiester glycosidase family protein [Patescibacteria group bacterium]|nr:phosphodiester glycosidase family protein [Patescibacteria group bacterium]